MNCHVIDLQKAASKAEKATQRHAKEQASVQADIQQAINPRDVLHENEYSG